MSKIDVVEARKMRAESMSLREIGKVFDASGEAVRLALDKPHKDTGQEGPSFDLMAQWALNAAQAFADEPRKDRLIITQARQIKVLRKMLAEEEARNKKIRDQERLFEKAKNGNLPKYRRKSSSNLTYHIESRPNKLLANTAPLLNISEGAFSIN